MASPAAERSESPPGLQILFKLLAPRDFVFERFRLKLFKPPVPASASA